MTEPLITLTDVTLHMAGRVLLQPSRLGLAPQERLGLIGDNGAGKSTLLAAIAGHLKPDGGTIAYRRGLRVTSLAQVTVLPDTTIKEVLMRPLAPLLRAIDRFAVEGAGPNGAYLQETIEFLGGWDWEHRIEQAATRVGIDDIMRRCATLSGGFKKRVAIAALTLHAPDVALLDEPTNHLDVDTVTWLETWLSQTKMAAIVVTHDRAFLDATATSMLELRGGQLRRYAGNYSDYLVARAMLEAQEQRHTSRQKRQLVAELAWAARAPQARTTKSRARLDRIEVAQATLGAAKPKATAGGMALAGPPRLGRDVLNLTEATFTPDGRRHPLWDPLTLRLRAKERWGIVGPNGIGKTTLLRVMTGTLAPTQGSAHLGKNTRVGFFDQHRTALNEMHTVRQALAPDGGDTVMVDGRPMHIATYLSRFAFDGTMLGQQVRQLSGGERNRLALAHFMRTTANVLLVDEPTNDLDLLTLHVLEEALIAYAGCVVVVSHDRAFLDRVVTGIVALTPRLEKTVDAPLPARVQVQPGSYWDFMARQAVQKPTILTKATAKQQQPLAADGLTQSEGPKRSQKLTFKERHELSGLPDTIQACETAIADGEASLLEPDVWRDRKAVQHISDQLEGARARLAIYYARWEALMARDEST